MERWATVNSQTIKKKESFLVCVFQKSDKLFNAWHSGIHKFRLCVRIEEKAPEQSVLDLEVSEDFEIFEIPQENTTLEQTKLDNRLLKVWQITTTSMPTPLEEEIADKEAAYGLKIEFYWVGNYMLVLGNKRSRGY